MPELLEELELLQQRHHERRVEGQEQDAPGRTRKGEGGKVAEWSRPGREHHPGMTTPALTGSCSTCGAQVLYGTTPVGIGDLCDTCYWNAHLIDPDSIHEDVRRTYVGKPAPDPQDLFDAIVAHARATGRDTVLGVGQSTPNGPSEYKVEIWVDPTMYNEGFEYLHDPKGWAWVSSKAEADAITAWVDATYAFSWNPQPGRLTGDAMFTKTSEAHPKHPVRSVEDVKLLFDHIAANWTGI